MSSSINTLLVRIILCVQAILLFSGDTQIQEIAIIAPVAGDTVAYDRGKLFIVSASKEFGDDLVVSAQWKTEQLFDVSSKAAKESFLKDFVKIFPGSATIEQLVFTFRYFKGYSTPDTFEYSFLDTFSIRALWLEPRFTQVAALIQKKDILGVIVNSRGWKDTVYTATYDDPSNETRTLYKIPVALIPGSNSIYFSPAGEKAGAIEFATTFGHESVPVGDRSGRFHNSALEQNCTSCHEGLPAADGGETMTADCGVCHREHFSAYYTHGPVEIKECGTCHSWSAGAGAVILEAGVPATCAACHEEIVTLAENSTVPHAVATECLTCHSPHSSDQNHYLKDEITALCSGCHDGFAINHPIGRHPVRFNIIETTGVEISCASCHNPHGSEYKKLLPVGGGQMELCSQCH